MLKTEISIRMLGFRFSGPSQVCLGPKQISMIKYFGKIVNDFWWLVIYAKASLVDVLQWSKYAAELYHDSQKDQNQIFYRMSPAGIHLLIVNNSNTRTRCEICSKLTIRTPERRQWRRSSIFIVSFEHVSHLNLLFTP